MRISIIAAVAENGVIGRGGELPWRLVGRPAAIQAADDGPHDHHGPADLGIDRPAAAGAADGRRLAASGLSRACRRTCAVAIESRRCACKSPKRPGDDEAFVIGGAEMYREALPRADRLYLTRVRADVEGDTYFPEVDMERLASIESRSARADDKNDYPHTVRNLRTRATEYASCPRAFGNESHDDQEAN